MQNQNFHFLQNEAYKIIEAVGFFLYSGKKLTQSIKGREQEEAYFLALNWQNRF
jgi:hypothetical protein